MHPDPHGADSPVEMTDTHLKTQQFAYNHVTFYKEDRTLYERKRKDFALEVVFN